MSENSLLDPALCWELGIAQQNKHGEGICGDSVVVSRSGDGVQIVLSDGLGSGIQANIASTLTTALLSGLTAGGVPIEDAIRAASAVLPTTRRQGLAYATFSLVRTEGRSVHILQYDSPQALFLRDGVSLPFSCAERTLAGKDVTDASLTMKCGDMLVLFSDGVSEAGRGVTTYSGWDRALMEDYLSRSIQPDDAAPRVAAGILSAVQAIDLFDFHDDTTVVVLRLRERSAVNLLIAMSDEIVVGDEQLRRFFSLDGKRVICGVSAVQTAAAYLGQEFRALRRSGEDAAPPICRLAGVELSLEAAQTLKSTIVQIEEARAKPLLRLEFGREGDGVSQLLSLLTEEASDVNLLLCGSGTKPRDDMHEKSTLALVLQLRELLIEEGKQVELYVC